jgi:hypothetical protein
MFRRLGSPSWFSKVSNPEERSEMGKVGAHKQDGWNNFLKSLLLLTREKKKKESPLRYALDEQTGKLHKCVREKPEDTIAAFFIILYLLAALAFFCWLLLDVWSDAYYFVRLSRYLDIARLKTLSFRLAAYATIGGGLGSTINGIRSLKLWHCNRFAFSRRFFWQYIVDPCVGSILGLFVYVMLRGGVAFLGGDITTGETGIPQGVTIFAIGTLAGYSSRKVLLWLDEQANRIFKISEKTTVKVPNLKGESLEAATAMLKAHNLAVGKVKRSAISGVKQDTVIDQKPLAESLTAKGKPVDVKIAAANA